MLNILNVLLDFLSGLGLVPVDLVLGFDLRPSDLGRLPVGDAGSDVVWDKDCELERARSRWISFIVL